MWPRAGPFPSPCSHPSPQCWVNTRQSELSLLCRVCGHCPQEPCPSSGAPGKWKEDPGRPLAHPAPATCFGAEEGPSWSQHPSCPWRRPGQGRAMSRRTRGAARTTHPKSPPADGEQAPWGGLVQVHSRRGPGSKAKADAHPCHAGPLGAGGGGKDWSQLADIGSPEHQPKQRRTRWQGPWAGRGGSMDQLRESSWGPASDRQGAGTQIGKLPPMGVGQAPKTVPQSRAPSRKGLARGGRPLLTTQPGFGQGSGRQSRGQRSWTPPPSLPPAPGAPGPARQRHSPRSPRWPFCRAQPPAPSQGSGVCRAPRPLFSPPAQGGPPPSRDHLCFSAGTWL